MSYFKRLAALAAVLALALSLLAGCAQTGDGIELAVCVGPEPVTLDPIYAEEIGDQTILAHLYENLMRLAPDGTVTNGMAKNVEQKENPDGTVTYTFRLRSARWSDGTAVRAADFVYAWRRLADPASYSPYAPLLSVVSGFDEARAAGDMTLLQVSAKNDTTLVVQLDGHYGWFLTQVCTSPATMPLREDVLLRLKAAAEALNEKIEEQGGAGTQRWWSEPTDLVTNGPYTTAAFDEDALEMTVSERYNAPQIGPRSLTFRFAATAEAAQALYGEKEVDAVWPLTEERLTELAAEEDWTPLPELGTYTALFNCGRDVFSDVLVRQAMNLVIDRNALAELAGVTAQPAQGLVPPGVPGSGEEDFRATSGPELENDPELYPQICGQARELLAQAGYDSGRSLGALEYLYVEDGASGAVAQALCRMWADELQVQVTPRAVTELELWTALRAGEYDLAGVELDAVGNDAECFLMEWTSDSGDNVARYENSAYDTLMSIIASAADDVARMGCLQDAEELLLGDYALAPLYTRGTDWDLRDTYTGGCRDPRGWFSFAGVILRQN